MGKNHPISVKLKFSMIETYVDITVYIVIKSPLGNPCFISFSDIYPELEKQNNYNVSVLEIIGFSYLQKKEIFFSGDFLIPQTPILD